MLPFILLCDIIIVGLLFYPVKVYNKFILFAVSHEKIKQNHIFVSRSVYTYVVRVRQHHTKYAAR
jgi:ethanolamine transporter EutH